MKTRYFDCACLTAAHTLRFVYDPDDAFNGEMPTIYVEIALSHYLPWYKRIWVAIKYIFKYDTSDHFDTWIINDVKDAEHMIEMLEEYKKQCKIFVDNFDGRTI